MEYIFLSKNNKYLYLLNTVYDIESSRKRSQQGHLEKLGKLLENKIYFVI